MKRKRDRRAVAVMADSDPTSSGSCGGGGEGGREERMVGVRVWGEICSFVGGKAVLPPLGTWDV